jgi:4-hydroxyphenylpyruvate dioxygenase
MRKSIATVSLSGPLAGKLSAIADAGFDGVEIFENDLLASPLRPEEVRRRAGDLGLRIELYQPFRDFEGTTALARDLRRAEHKFDLMERLGASLLLVCSNVAADTIRDDTLAAEQLRLLADRAAAHGVRIAYEALAWGRHVDDYRHAWRIVESAGHPALGVCLDSFHILSRGADPRGIEDIPAEKIFFLQLADAPRMAMDVLQWSRHHRCFPGQGGFDLTGLTAHVLKAGYDGPLSLEVFNDVLRQADPKRAARDAMRSLILLEESLTPPSRAVVPAGFAFAELSAPDIGRLSGLLGALGLARTNAVWERNRARIRLREGGPESETELSAIGLETTDPRGTVRRAEALKAPRTAEEAVTAPDGTELVFCATDRPDGEGTGITHIDHVALTQPWHHFAEASLFYRGLLGLRPDASMELADPYGLLRSQAVAAPDGGVRIALNVGARPGTPQWQHVALSSQDIVATAHRLIEYGAVLAIPDNYYDDLEARHDLGPERHRTLRELNLLYDRDDGGEFLHLYTPAIGHVFVEIVQRLGGYRGYGAVNAPIRLAAQHAEP